ncbi:MAG: hypothetical protein U0441_01540 [Polyangiaceae bacterium]
MTTTIVQNNRAQGIVLAVGVDELTRTQLEWALRNTEFRFDVAPRGDILARIPPSGERTIVLIEWSASDAEELAALCDDLRAAGPPDRLAVVALGGPGDRSALLRAIDASVSDVVGRPFDEALLLARLRIVASAMARASAFSPQEALREALDHGEGEVCVRAGEDVARVHVRSGEIAWAHVSSVPSTFADVTSLAGISLEPDVVEAVKRECRERGVHFMDVLVSWGLIDRERARAALHAFVTRRVQMILDLPGATALFLPKRSPPSGNVPRVASPEPSSPGPASMRAPASLSLGPGSSPPERPTWIGELVRAAMRLDGALCAAAIELRKVTCVERAGEDLDGRLVWSQVSALASLGPEAEEMLAVSGPRCVVTRVIARDPSMALLVSFASANVSIGLARVAVAGLLSRMASPQGAAD